MDEPSPEGPLFLLAGPSSHHTAVYLGAGDVTAHSMACCADSAMMFPLGYSEGISISVNLKQLVSICPEILKNAGVEADRLRDRFCSGKPSAIPSCPDLEHIFAPLFSAPVSVRISLLKLKVLEILIYLSNMNEKFRQTTASKAEHKTNATTREMANCIRNGRRSPRKEALADHSLIVA